jgi:plastocyanin
MISKISFPQGLTLSLFSIFGSWFFYDITWENKIIRKNPILGHVLTLGWFFIMSYVLTHSLSGRAAYIHVGAMLGTWMTANVFMRIIPRQIKMVEASHRGEPVNQEWAKNAKNRSTHNTYFTLPVIFIMLSNHFPTTYGHEFNWPILIFLCGAGAAIREYFVVRLKNPKRSLFFGILGVSILITVITFSQINFSHDKEVSSQKSNATVIEDLSSSPENENKLIKGNLTLSGQILFYGEVPQGKKLNLPAACAQQHKGEVFSNEFIVKQSKVKNVLIRITKGHELLFKPGAPQNEVFLDQKGCIYTPRVVGVRVGQKVTFINSDPLFHNVRSVTNQNERFNVAMPRKDQRETKIFNKPEIFLQAKCSVHPWMGAYIAIIEHPFFDVTDDEGRFEISNLAPGRYEIEIWHEKFGLQKHEIQIKSGENLIKNFELRNLK